MNNESPYLNNEMSIDDGAIVWRVLLADKDVTEEDKINFNEWFESNPLHKEAWYRLEILWAGMDEFDGDEFKEKPVHKGNGWGQMVAVATALFLIVGSAGAYFTSQPAGFTSGLLADYRTSVGEQKTVTLADGSIVTLGALSALSVSFENNKEKRQVTLHHGEVYFSVAKDASRPFTVTAGKGVITVLGTEFNVKHSIKGNDSHQIKVAVSTGAVRVSPDDTQQNSIDLIPGQAVAFEGGTLGSSYRIDVNNVGFWRQGRMIFQAVPLNEVLYDLERYQKGRIVIIDDKISSLPVTGIFNTKNPEAAMEAISNNLPVKMTRVTDYLTLLQLKK